MRAGDSNYSTGLAETDSPLKVVTAVALKPGEARLTVGARLMAVAVWLNSMSWEGEMTAAAAATTAEAMTNLTEGMEGLTTMESPPAEMVPFMAHRGRTGVTVARRKRETPTPFPRPPPEVSFEEGKWKNK